MDKIKQYHYKLYKPYGYISQFVSTQRYSHKKKYLGELYEFHRGTMAIGRLDEHSEGLLLLTTDGKVSNALNSSNYEKEYYALVDGIISSEAISRLQKGVEIGFGGKKYITRPCKAFSINTPTLPQTKQRVRNSRHGPTSWISITLTQGKFRQVRKMTAAIGFPTLRLVRVRIGEHTVEGLECGSCEAMAELLP
ncbi:MAG: pseudouridine synthase [Bacteroidetes bacterium]|nr:MAG: pseudouridine synthase [Bacteroidota bacterium]